MTMTPAEMEEFLSARRLAHFATVSPSGRPGVRPIWYVWADGAFWFTTRLNARRTGTDLTAGSSAAVSIASEDRPYRAVIAHGTPEVWRKDVPAWLERISTRYGEREGLRWLQGALKEPDRVVLRMVPTHLITWDYGKGDYRRLNRGESLRTELPE
jgi:nitroimidazol reductase NimA-like FMN-containing flavoprotein (pyridoxamine 5'-phosphate oxidase superfamily)